MKLSDLCQNIVVEIDGCLGCAVVDLDTGLPLAMEVVPGSPLNAQAMELISVAGVEHFRGKTVWQMELEMSGGTGVSQTAFVREIQTTTTDMHHYMSVVPGWESTLLILITAKAANLGMGWIAMRQALARVGEAREQERIAAGRNSVTQLRPDGSVAPPSQVAAPSRADPPSQADAQGPDSQAGPEKPPNAAGREGPAAPIPPAPIPPDSPGQPQADSPGEQASPPSQDADYPEVRVPRWRGGHQGRRTN